MVGGCFFDSRIFLIFRARGPSSQGYTGPGGISSRPQVFTRVEKGGVSSVWYQGIAMDRVYTEAV